MSEDVGDRLAETDGESTGERRGATDTIFEVLVVALTMLAAFAAYRGAVADDNSAEYELVGETLLTESNRLEAEADRNLIEQYRLYDEYFVAEVDSFAEEYYFSNLDDQVREAALFNRTLTDPDEAQDPFSEDYIESLYAESWDVYDQSVAAFEEAATEGERALGYQEVVLTFAIGLSFAAWGGLADGAARRRTRRFFLILATAATVIGTLQLIGV